VFNEHSYEAVRAVGLEPVYWSAWGMDWETISAERILGLVEPDLAPGAILVLHDSARYAERPDVTPTIDAIALIAACAAGRGVTLGPL
jgi:hypothetical protein